MKKKSIDLKDLKVSSFSTSTSSEQILGGGTLAQESCVPDTNCGASGDYTCVTFGDACGPSWNLPCNSLPVCYPQTTTCGPSPIL